MVRLNTRTVSYSSGSCIIAWFVKEHFVSLLKYLYEEVCVVLIDLIKVSNVLITNTKRYDGSMTGVTKVSDRLFKVRLAVGNASG